MSIERDLKIVLSRSRDGGITVSGTDNGKAFSMSFWGFPALTDDAAINYVMSELTAVEYMED